MAYADASDIEARWRALSADEETRADALLDDASAILNKLVKVDESDTEQAELLKIVCCDMVIRSLSSTAGAGIDQSSMTAGPYSQSFHFVNPSGDLYLTKMEKRLLGIATGYIGSIQPMIGGDHAGC